MGFKEVLLSTKTYAALGTAGVTGTIGPVISLSVENASLSESLENSELLRKGLVEDLINANVERSYALEERDRVLMENGALNEKIKQYVVRLFNAEGNARFWKTKVEELEKDKKELVKKVKELEETIELLNKLQEEKEGNKQQWVDMEKVMEKVGDLSQTVNSRLDSLVQELMSAEYKFEVPGLETKFNQLKEEVQSLKKVIERFSNPESTAEWYAKLFKEACTGKESLDICKPYIES